MVILFHISVIDSIRSNAVHLNKKMLICSFLGVRTYSINTLRLKEKHDKVILLGKINRAHWSILSTDLLIDVNKIFVDKFWYFCINPMFLLK